ncbi:MAG TPA: hypothetical protein VE692_07380 [Nitrososphaera sp.]|jgi:hypothetical protein|nr:hypothetical protein [Nitrososphaera sp.]
MQTKINSRMQTQEEQERTQRHERRQQHIKTAIINKQKYWIGQVTENSFFNAKTLFYC